MKENEATVELVDENVWMVLEKRVALETAV
jgi:hypothetical protein